jgi:hypothetical protein
VAAPPPKPADAKKKAAFVMVVKSPTAVVKEPASAAPASTAATGTHPGGAVGAAPAAPAASSTRAATLEPGEAGKRQIREAVLAAQSSIEACVAEHVARRDLLPRPEGERRKLHRIEGVLKLTLSPQGRVTRLSTSRGELAGAELEECLGRAAASWTFPGTDSEYAVDVPVAVVLGGAPR